MKKCDSVSFLNIRFDLFEIEELADALLKSCEGNCTVITPNLDHVIRTNKNPELLQFYNSVEVCVNDSRILKKIARFFRVNLGSVIPGSDLTRNLIEKISGTDTSITIIGCSEDTIEKVRKKYNLVNITHHNPPMGFINHKEEVDKCISIILENPSQLVFLGIGSPRQEILAKRIKAEGGTGVVLCIGASLQFLSGEEERAPLIMQKLSLEWLFRLLQSPKRLAKRYLVDSWGIIPLLYRYSKKRRNAR